MIWFGDAQHRRMQMIDTESIPWEEPDPEQPSAHLEERVRPLRQALGSLPHLTRLRAQAVYPLGSALSELPPLQVGP